MSRQIEPRLGYGRRVARSSMDHHASEHGPNVRAPRPNRRTTVTDALGALAATWGVMMAISPILQVRRILERGTSADISIGYLAVLQIGFTLWIAYGIALRNAAIIVPNGVALLVGAATIGVAFRFRRALPER